MAMKKYNLDKNSKLTDEQFLELKEAALRPLSFDEDCPELTDEELARFKRIAEINKEERNSAGKTTAAIHSSYHLTAREEAELEEENRTFPDRKSWLSSSYMVGDKLLDCLAGKNFGVNPILLGTGYGKEELKKAKKEGKQDFSYFPTFLDAVKTIL